MTTTATAIRSEADVTFADYAEINFRTYEDIQELYCADGWGCKCCGKLFSPNWLQCEGDTYCDGCQAHMLTDMPELVFERYPTRAESGLSRTVARVHNPDSDGFELAAFARREHERIYGY